MRYLAIDLGDKRTGLAVGDTVTRIASPVGVLEVPIAVREGEALLEALAKAVKDQLGDSPYARAGVVVGLPLNMDGTEGPRAKLVRAFANRLAQRIGPTRPIAMVDERLSSADADWAMARSGLSHQQKKARRDALAAAAILREFLNTLGTGASPGPVEPVQQDVPEEGA